MTSALQAAREYLAAQTPHHTETPEHWPDAMRLLAAMVDEIDSAPVMTTDGYSVWEAHEGDTQIECKRQRVALLRVED